MKLATQAPLVTADKREPVVKLETLAPVVKLETAVLAVMSALEVLRVTADKRETVVKAEALAWVAQEARGATVDKPELVETWHGAVTANWMKMKNAMKTPRTA